MFFGPAGMGFVLMAANAFFWLLLLVGGGFLLYAAVLRWSGARPPAAGGEDPQAVLARRYARGEINREQFLQMREDLAALRGGERP